MNNISEKIDKIENNYIRRACVVLLGFFTVIMLVVVAVIEVIKDFVVAVYGIAPQAGKYLHEYGYLVSEKANELYEGLKTLWR